MKILEEIVKKEDKFFMKKDNKEVKIIEYNIKKNIHIDSGVKGHLDKFPVQLFVDGQFRFSPDFSKRVNGYIELHRDLEEDPSTVGVIYVKYQEV